MASRAQTAVEYILLIGAVILFVALIVIVLKQNVFNAAGEAIDRTAGQLAALLGNFSR